MGRGGLLAMTANLERILGVEAMAAAQGVEFRAPLQTSPLLKTVLAAVRARIPTVKDDRYLSPEIETAASPGRQRRLDRKLARRHPSQLGK